MTTKIDRPLSPHLQIYKLPLTAILSIVHRGTGVFLTIGLVVFVIGLMSIAEGPKSFASFQGLLNSWVGVAILVAWSFSLFLHLCHGIRHLFWDAGEGFLRTNMNRLASIEIAASVVLTALVWIIA